MILASPGWRLRLTVVAVALIATLSATSAAFSGYSADREIAIGDYWFCAAGYASSPCPVTVSAGETVAWRNQGNIVHNVRECGASCDPPTGSPAFSSPFIPSGSTYSHLFSSAGTYNYYCSIHPEMRGVLTVIPATPAPTAPPTAAPTAPPPPPPTAASTPPPTAPPTAQQSTGPSVTESPTSDTTTTGTPTPARSTPARGSASPTRDAESPDSGGGAATWLIVAGVAGLVVISGAGAAAWVRYRRRRGGNQ